jgi:hypothetical protein
VLANIKRVKIDRETNSEIIEEFAIDTSDVACIYTNNGETLILKNNGYQIRVKHTMKDLEAILGF